MKARSGLSQRRDSLTGLEVTHLGEIDASPEEFVANAERWFGRTDYAPLDWPPVPASNDEDAQ